MGALLTAPVTAMYVERSASTWCTAAVSTMQGWRRSFEDQHIFEAHLSENVGIFAVLDGHGGTLAAELSREILQDGMARLVEMYAGELSPNDALDGLRQTFADADAELRRRLRAGDSSGTTVVAAVCVCEAKGQFTVHLAHAGDSRAVMTSSGNLIATVDHKPNRPDETERIRAAGGSVEPGALGGPMRVDGSLAVSRAFGDFAFKPPHKPPGLCKISPMPEVKSVKCRSGDWLLLACDGIFDVFTNDEVHRFINERVTPDGGDTVVEMLRGCLDKGSKDNCTAMLVQFKDAVEPRAKIHDVLCGDFAKATPEIQGKYHEFYQHCGCTARDAVPTLGKLDQASPVKGSSSGRSSTASGTPTGAESQSAQKGKKPSMMGKALQALNSVKFKRSSSTGLDGAGTPKGLDGSPKG